MTNIGDGFKNIFLAGIGAMAYTGEKGKEIIDQLVEKGEITLDEGKELSEELSRKAGDTAASMREGVLEARMSLMTPEERTAFAAKAVEIAEALNAADAEAAAAAEAEVEAEAEEVVEEAAVDGEPEAADEEVAGE